MMSAWQLEQFARQQLANIVIVLTATRAMGPGVQTWHTPRDSFLGICFMSATMHAAGSRLLAWLQLFRAPNVFTAMADVAMGYFFVAGDASPPETLALLVLASSLLYTAGMVLNDVYDFDIDAKERPQRPLPSGRIALSIARRLGYALLIVGAAAGWAAGYMSGEADLPWRSGVVATLLAGCVVLYDAGVKRTFAGPLVMGGCRFLNVLLGMSAAPHISPEYALLAGYDAAQLLVAGGIGIYIVGVTWFARTEADAKSSSLVLITATLVMLAGVAFLAIFPFAESAPPLQMKPMRVGVELTSQSVWAVLLALIAFPIIGRCLAAVSDPIPLRVQTAVKRAILSLILFDGAVTLAVAGPMWAIAVLALFVPTMLLAAWVYST
jgi:4-hydroxybenzoate polyprenyltransferase